MSGREQIVRHALDSTGTRGNHGARQYAEGFADGIDETLRQLDGTSTVAPAGCYSGPMPEELRSWIAVVRSRFR